MEQQFTTLITAKRGWFDINLKEVWRYRDLIWLFTKRSFVLIYKQTILGPAWVLLQPLMTTLIYTLVFGGIADTDGGAKPTLYQLYSKESGYNRQDSGVNHARIDQVRLCYPEAGRCFDHLIGSGYAIYKAPVYLDIYVEFAPGFEGETAELTVCYLGSNDVLLNTNEQSAPLESEFGVPLQMVSMFTDNRWEISVPNGVIQAQSARLGQGVFTALDGTPEDPVMLNRLERGIYFIEGVGKDSDTAPQRDLPAGLYIVAKGHIRCIPAEDLPITTL